MTASMIGSGTPEQVVRDFFQAWEKDGFTPAFERYMDPDGTWQNAGFPEVKGRTSMLSLLDQFLAFSGMPFSRVEMKNIAVTGDTVLTERIDHLYNHDRSKQHSAPIMGIFVVKNGLITRYSDYFDPRPFLEMAAAAGA